MSIFLPNQEQYKPGTGEVLNSLVSEYQWLNLLIDSGKPYEALLHLIVQESNREMYTGFGAYAGGRVKTRINLRSGRFNSYRQHIVDKLDFLKLIDFNEKHYLSSRNLDEILKEKNRTGRIAYEEPTQNYFKRRRF